MLLKEKYEYLNSKINLDKEFIVPYETIMDYYNQMNDIMDIQKYGKKLMKML